VTSRRAGRLIDALAQLRDDLPETVPFAPPASPAISQRCKR
jgi:hypothetical protein